MKAPSRKAAVQQSFVVDSAAAAGIRTSEFLSRDGRAELVLLTRRHITNVTLEQLGMIEMERDEHEPGEAEQGARIVARMISSRIEDRDGFRELIGEILSCGGSVTVRKAERIRRNGKKHPGEKGARNAAEAVKHVKELLDADREIMIVITMQSHMEPEHPRHKIEPLKGPLNRLAEALHDTGLTLLREFDRALGVIRLTAVPFNYDSLAQSLSASQPNGENKKEKGDIVVSSVRLQDILDEIAGSGVNIVVAPWGNRRIPEKARTTHEAMEPELGTEEPGTKDPAALRPASDTSIIAGQPA